MFWLTLCWDQANLSEDKNSQNRVFQIQSFRMITETEQKLWGFTTWMCVLCVCYLTVWVPSCRIQRYVGMTSHYLHKCHIGLQPCCYTVCHHSPLAGWQHTVKHFRGAACSSTVAAYMKCKICTMIDWHKNNDNWCYLTCPFNTNSVVFGITAEGTILSWNKQLTLTIDGCTLQVTRLAGDANVIS